MTKYSAFSEIRW